MMLKKLFGNALTDLGTLEGDYRVSQLQSDISQGILYMSIVGVSNLALLHVDAILFSERLNPFLWMVVYRVGYVLVTALLGVLMKRTTRVRSFDRLMSGWILFTIVFLLLINFTRPVNYMMSAIDTLVPFVIYVLSPLRIQKTAALALAFSTGTIIIGVAFKSGIDPLFLNVAVIGQIISHMLGWVSNLQIQTYRRKSFRAFIDEKDAKEMVAYLANIDPLTKSLTRRQFMNIAESELRRYLRYRRPLSILILDADRFKGINDAYGHHAGDLVLRSLSLIAMEHKRAQDTFGRLGGEEFGLIMPETALGQAVIVAERIRRIWEESPVKLDEELIHSTMSIGVAEAVSTDQSLEDLLRRADRMLYKAKEQGRNCVVAE
jgi:diguanylate cyclase (GGDEF)-like protein